MRTSWLNWSWRRRACFALIGANSQILPTAPVDAAVITGRGIAALIPARFGGLAPVVSFRHAYRLPPAEAAAVRARSTVVVLSFDLSLITFAAGRRPAGLAATFGLRSVVTVLAVFTCASVIEEGAS